MKYLVRPRVTGEEFHRKLTPELLEQMGLLEESLGKISLAEELEGRTKYYINDMNLSEQFLKASRIEGIVNNEEVIAATNAAIAERFTIQFVKWLKENYLERGNNLYVNYEEFKSTGKVNNITIETALEIFKKENDI